jgi:hypothetical protein
MHTPRRAMGTIIHKYIEGKKNPGPKTHRWRWTADGGNGRGIRSPRRAARCDVPPSIHSQRDMEEDSPPSIIISPINRPFDLPYSLKIRSVSA